MPRQPRAAPGGYVYHCLNRAVARLPLFQKDGDYEAFERVLLQAQERHPIRILSYCVMPNHWHFVLWPEEDGQVTNFLRWLTHTHTQRWHAHHHTSGTGHLYQGRFKSFPVQEDDHLYTLLRYVERNPLRANLVERAEAWRWGSLYQRVHKGLVYPILSRWPVPMPRNWLDHVHKPQTEKELEAVRRSIQKGSPLGKEAWREATAKELGIEFTLRSRGRPRQQREE